MNDSPTMIDKHRKLLLRSAVCPTVSVKPRTHSHVDSTAPRRRRFAVTSAAILAFTGACSINTNGLQSDGGHKTVDAPNLLDLSDRRAMSQGEASAAPDASEPDLGAAAQPDTGAGGTTDLPEAGPTDLASETDNDTGADTALDAPTAADLPAETQPPGIICSSGAQCGGNSPACLPGGTCGCSSSAECSRSSDARVCDLTTQTCVQCVSTSQCAAKGSSWTCDLVLHSCIQGCTSGSCRNGQLCNRTQQVCVDCLTDTNCSGQKCDSQLGVCVDCLTSADCRGSTSTCSATHVCIRPCGAARSCAQGLVCDPAGPGCVECVTSSDCGRSGFCLADQTCF
jgi:hypothetical protein